MIDTANSEVNHSGEENGTSLALVPIQPDPVLAQLDPARQMLAKARSASDAKKVADLAKASEVLFRRQQYADEIIAHATAIRVEAFALMGEFLQEAPKNGGTRGQLQGPGVIGGYQWLPPINSPTLAEIGITKRESVQAQALAELKDKQPELYEKVRSGKVAVSKAVGAVKKAEKEATSQPDVIPFPEPTHPFAELMAATTKLAGAFTRAMSGDTPEAVNLKHYLSACGLVDHLPSDDGTTHAQFLPLMGVKRVLELAGQKKPEKIARVQHEYMKASGGWLPPMVERRRNARQARKAG